ncbi:MAG TPA: glutamine synthetase family protein [Candidatus Dormibacteraeota bacterium]|jgi:glutamine synthetase|nr:glutamine synthetase family protein [Candidatus Dormibacteraeota bacterium]
MAATADGRVTGAPAPDELRRKVLDAISSQGIDSVRLVTLDMHGVPRAKLLTARHFERVMTRGHPWALPLLACDLWEDMSEEERALGVEIGFGNGLLLPDLDSFVKLPWLRGTAQVMADVFDREMVPQPSPRQVLASVLRRAAALGYEPVFGTELEFYVYKPELGDQGFDAVFGRQSWFSINAIGLTQPFIDAVYDVVRAMNVPVYEMFSEHGAGQFEVNLEPGSGVKAIDDVVNLKIAIKEVAQSLGLKATFLARPTNLWETPVSGYHLHQTLKDASGGNAFYDPGAPDSLSEVARHYVGGQLAHAVAMTGIAAPTVTAYKRYVPGTWGPVRVSWAVDNRTALIRAIRSEENTHIENRLGSSDANPYLLAAVNVAAGLDGVARRLEPGPPGSGQLVEDETLQRLPRTLAEGVAAYAADEVLVEALGRDFSRIYCGVLRRDWTRYLEHVSDWEIREYREML